MQRILTGPEQEFIGREKQLPADLNMSRVGVVPDTSGVPLGEPLIDFTVRSVWDTRPINGRDFSTCIAGVAINDNFVQLTATVPKGRIFVPRSVEVWFQEPNQSIERTDAYFELLSNRNVVPNFQYWFGGATDQPVPCFFMVDEEQTYGIQIFATGLVEDQDPGAIVKCIVYGNNLVKSGRALPFEVGNPLAPSKTSTVQKVPISKPEPQQLPAAQQRAPQSGGVSVRRMERAPPPPPRQLFKR